MQALRQRETDGASVPLFDDGASAGLTNPADRAYLFVMRNRHPIIVVSAWIALGIGSVLAYTGWQMEPGLEERLALGLTMLVLALVVLSLRYLV